MKQLVQYVLIDGYKGDCLQYYTVSVFVVMRILMRSNYNSCSSSSRSSVVRNSRVISFFMFFLLLIHLLFCVDYVYSEFDPYMDNGGTVLGINNTSLSML